MNVQQTRVRYVQHSTFVLMVYAIIKIIANMLIIIAFTACLKIQLSAVIVLMDIRLMKLDYVRVEALLLPALRVKLVKTDCA